MTKARLFIFLGIITAIFALVDALIYNATALAFNITDSSQLLCIGAGLALLSVCFILSNIWGRYQYNVLTRALYTMSATWIGFSFYLFLASILYGLSALAGYAENSVGMGLLGMACLVSIYGVLHARSIKVKQVSVALKNVPASWKGRKAVFVSDLHLGQLHGPKFAERVVRAIEEQKPDMVFIGGDLFDGTGAPDLAELSVPLSKLTAPLGTFFIMGNHEEFGDSEQFIEAVRSHGIRVLMDEMVEIEGVQLIGVDYRTTTDAEHFKEILSGLHIDDKKPSILLKHEPSHLEVAREAGVSLQMSGHTHKAQMWPLEYLARLSYKGFVYGLNKLGEMQVYTSSGVGNWGPPLRVGTDGEVVVFEF